MNRFTRRLWTQKSPKLRTQTSGMGWQPGREEPAPPDWHHPDRHYKPREHKERRQHFQMVSQFPEVPFYWCLDLSQADIPGTHPSPDFSLLHGRCPTWSRSAVLPVPAYTSGQGVKMVQLFSSCRKPKCDKKIVQTGCIRNDQEPTINITSFNLCFSLPSSIYSATLTGDWQLSELSGYILFPRKRIKFA